jgi:hypothetical protein
MKKYIVDFGYARFGITYSFTSQKEADAFAKYWNVKPK